MFELTIKANTLQEVFDQMQELLHQQNPVTYPGKMTEGSASVAPAVPIAPPAAPVAPVATAPTASVAPTFPVAPTAPSTPPLQTAAPTYTVEQLAVAGGTLAQNGKYQECLDLLTKYDIPSIASLKPEQFGVFAADLRALGAQI